MSEEGSLGEPQSTGIVLRRKKRDDSSPSKAGDALAIAELVQKLCQVHLPGHAYLYWKLGWRAAFVVHKLGTCITSTFCFGVLIAQWAGKHAAGLRLLVHEMLAAYLVLHGQSVCQGCIAQIACDLCMHRHECAMSSF